MEEEEPIYKRMFERYFQESEKGGEHLEKAFKEVVKYLDKLNTILKTGTPEQKKQAMREYTELRQLVSKKVEKYKKESGLSEEEMRAVVQDPKAYKHDEWEMIQASVEEIKSMKDLNTNIAQNLPKEGDKAKKKKTRNKWIKS